VSHRWGLDILGPRYSLLIKFKTKTNIFTLRLILGLIEFGHLNAMKILFWFLLALTILLIDGQPQTFVNTFNLPQQRQLPRRLAVDSFTENVYNNEDKALADGALKVALALLYARLTFVAEFPTAATSYNISDQCK